MTELAISLGPQVQIAQEALAQYVPLVATLGTVTLGGLWNFFARNGERDVVTAVVEVGNDEVVYRKGRRAYFTHKDLPIQCSGDPKGVSGQEKVVPCRGVVRPGEDERIDRLPPHFHTADRAHHVPSRLGRCRDKQP